MDHRGGKLPSSVDFVRKMQTMLDEESTAVAKARSKEEQLANKHAGNEEEQEEEEMDITEARRQARHFETQARDLADDAVHPEIAMTLGNLGLVCDRELNYPDARKYNEQALAMYKKIDKLDVMGGEKGLRKRMLSYGSGLAEDDPERVTRAKQFLDLVKKRFEKLLKDDL